MADFSTEWISSRFQGRLTQKAERRAAELEREGWSVSWIYAGEIDGKHMGQLLLTRS